MSKRILNVLAALLLAGSIVGCDEKPAADAKPEAPAEEKKAEEKNEEPKAKEAEEKKEEPAAGSESSASKKSALPDNMNAGETKHFGAEFALKEEPITLADAIKKSGENAGPVKISAKMEQVCKKKGCWFTLAGEGVDKPVRVRMKDYGFFVPRNANGADAVVEGTIATREIPQEEAQHYADEAVKPGETAKKVEGPEKVYEFTATAVQVTMPAKG